MTAFLGCGISVDPESISIYTQGHESLIQFVAGKTAVPQLFFLRTQFFLLRTLSFHLLQQLPADFSKTKPLVVCILLGKLGVRDVWIGTFGPKHVTLKTPTFRSRHHALACHFKNHPKFSQQDYIKVASILKSRSPCLPAPPPFATA